MAFSVIFWRSVIDTDCWTWISSQICVGFDRNFWRIHSVEWLCRFTECAHWSMPRQKVWSPNLTSVQTEGYIQFSEHGERIHQMKRKLPKRPFANDGCHSRWIWVCRWSGILVRNSLFTFKIFCNFFASRMTFPSWVGVVQSGRVLTQGEMTTYCRMVAGIRR